LATKHSSAALIHIALQPTAGVPVQEFVGAPCYFVLLKCQKSRRGPIWSRIFDCHFCRII